MNTAFELPCNTESCIFFVAGYSVLIFNAFIFNNI